MTLSLLVASSVFAADDLNNLQRQTNTAYEQMKQAENRVNKTRKELQSKQDSLDYYRKKITEAEKEFQAAQQASQNAEANLATTTRRWNELSEALYQKWRQ